MNNSSKIKFTDYLLVFMLVAISGMNYFYLLKEYITISFIITVIILFPQYPRIKLSDLYFILPMLLIELFHAFISESMGIVPIIGITLRLFLGLLIIKHIGIRFVEVFTKLMVILSIISAPFYILSFDPAVADFMINNFAPNFEPLFENKNVSYEIHPNILIYTFNHAILPNTNILRNCGPFYEPGMFGVFLNIALLFNFIRVKNKFNPINIILVAAIISTFSTSGYIAMFLVFLGSALKLTRGINIAFFILGTTLFYFAFTSLPFMKEKIDTNIQDVHTTTSRFGSFNADLIYIYSNPLVGTGRYTYENKGISVWDYDSRHRNNGVSKFMVNYGIPLFIFYLILIWRSFKNISAFFKSSFSPIVSIVIILILGFSQIIFQYPFFISFVFYKLVYKLNHSD